MADRARSGTVIQLPQTCGIAEPLAQSFHLSALTSQTPALVLKGGEDTHKDSEIPGAAGIAPWKVWGAFLSLLCLTAPSAWASASALLLPGTKAQVWLRGAWLSPSASHRLTESCSGEWL